MSDQTCEVYNPAQALRTGGRGVARDALLQARERTVALIGAYRRALGDAAPVDFAATLNPPLWEWGHIAWFQEFWIARNRQRDLGTRCDPLYERAPSAWRDADLCFDSSRVAHASRWELSLSSAQVLDYLASTLDRTLALLAAVPDETDDSAMYFFRLCALHEEMHVEAGLYMARALSIDVADVSCRAVAPCTAESVIQVPAQTHRMGWEGRGFAFDNELGPHDVALEDFAIDAQAVSWQRFLDFVRDGGYKHQRWWDDEGWSWLQRHGRPRRDDASLDPAAAAIHLSAYEAGAWCRWAGRRLPTEAEWECTALTQPGFHWGSVWEWTASRFEPYPGFVAHPYRDYSAPWFGSRQVLRGACAATSAALAHPRYRNFFLPDRKDIFSGFRSCAALPARLQV